MLSISDRGALNERRIVMKDWTLEQREYAQRIKDMNLTEDEADEYLWNEYQNGHILKRTYNWLIKWTENICSENN